MQDNYVGDIGDYGKYGFLRQVCKANLSLAVNWYKVNPQKIIKQDDGKYISYLTKPQIYRCYDPFLFDSLNTIVNTEHVRKIERIEKEELFRAKYFSDAIPKNRLTWHENALQNTKDTDVVFLDPDNGLESFKMYKSNSATEKHVKWSELKDYYDRGQNVILYQHRPQMTKKETCIENILQFQNDYLHADCVMLLEFPKFTNRFYFIFLHQQYINTFDKICSLMEQIWGKNDFCRKINID